VRCDFIAFINLFFNLQDGWLLVVQKYIAGNPIPGPEQYNAALNNCARHWFQ
jgi:hypothetical protein